MSHASPNLADRTWRYRNRLLRKFKTHYGKYYDKEQKYIQILGIDTTNQRTDSADPFLDNHEFLHLGNPVITSANVMQFRKRNQFRWLPEKLPAFLLLPAPECAGWWAMLPTSGVAPILRPTLNERCIR